MEHREGSESWASFLGANREAGGRRVLARLAIWEVAAAFAEALRERGVRSLATFLLALSRLSGLAATGALVHVS